MTFRSDNKGQYELDIEDSFVPEDVSKPITKIEISVGDEIKFDESHQN